MHTERQTLPALCATVLFLLAPSSLSAAILLAEYTFDTDLNPTFLADGVDSGSTITAVKTSGFGPAWSGSVAGIAADGSTYAGQPFNDVASSGGPMGVAFARRFHSDGLGDFKDYYAFSINLALNQVVDLGSVSFDLGFRSEGPNAYRLQMSPVSNFSSGVVTLGEADGYNVAAQNFLGAGLGGTLGVTQASGATNLSWNRYENNLNLAANEALEDTIYFRLYLKGGYGGETSSRSNVYLDNIQIYASSSSSIPEPGSLGLILVGALGIFARNRQRLRG